MPTTRFPTPIRAAKVLSATGLGLLTAALVVSPASVSPASAAVDCDGLAADAADYEAELRCASEATEGAQTITLTDSFTVPATAQNRYSGTQPLTVEGASAGITITGPGRDNSDLQVDGGAFLEVSLGLEGPVAQEVPLDDVIPVPPGAGPDVTVSGLTVTGFSGTGTIAHAGGGTLHLDGVDVSGNGLLATPGGPGAFPGGAAVAALGDIVITDSVFQDNAGGLGGAVSNWPVLMSQGPEADGAPSLPTVTVTGSTFAGNEAVAGAAIFSFGSTDVSGSAFAQNVAETGGAVASFGPAAAFTGSSFTDNLATSLSSAEGYIEGGALAVDGEVTIADSTLRGNASDGIGGAIAFSVGAEVERTSLAVTDSLLDANSSAGAGGAVWFEGGVEVTGSTFIGNESADGPAAIAVSAPDADVSVTNSTVVANASEAAAPAIAVDGADGVAITHSTFADNSSAGAAVDLGVLDATATALTASVWSAGGTVASCEIDGAATTAANFDADGSCTADWSGPGDIGEGLDPQLGTLADNGGPTPTLLPAASGPLVDAVDDATSDVTVDQRGVTRPQGQAKDIGAVELEQDAQPQGSLIEFEVPTDAGIIFGTADPALAVTDIAWIPTGDLDTPPPADTALPYGAAGFTVDVPGPGDSVEITLTAPRPFTTLLKSTDGVWGEVGDATFSDDGTTVTYTLTDGGELDEDGEANGLIVDPVALAVQATFTG
ncbi:choice-of-anchor U domain-containing protein [Demequina sp. SO4-18]|uniref:choice-of-anchor U domain-containing protein n=1 Tax=Demequina sp. SO4-18 TaxID=3401026 RepID=UPI003B5CAB77